MTSCFLPEFPVPVLFLFKNVLKKTGLGNLDFEMEREQTATFAGDDVLEKSCQDVHTAYCRCGETNENH